MWKGEVAHGESVYEHVVGRKLSGGAAHGFVGGAEDIDAINFLRLDDSERDSYFGACCEFFVDALASALGELLGVVQHVVRETGGEDDCRRDDRAGERTAPSFINARYKMQTSRTERILVREVAGHFSLCGLSSRLGCLLSLLHRHRGFAGAVAEVVECGAADAAMGLDFDFGNTW